MRTGRDITTEELAQRAGVTRRTVERLERGEELDPTTTGRLIATVGLMAATRAGAIPSRLDDPALRARQRAMSMGERLESGFELCSFAVDLAGAARG